MTTDQIRIAVVECLGWVKVDPPKIGTWGTTAHDKNWSYLHQLPNYPASLDACAEFEKTIQQAGLEDKYIYELLKVCFVQRGTITIEDYENGVGWDHEEWFFATALQRCEAYLRVKGKWEEAA